MDLLEVTIRGVLSRDDLPAKLRHFKTDPVVNGLNGELEQSSVRYVLPFFDGEKWVDESKSILAIYEGHTQRSYIGLKLLQKIKFEKEEDPDISDLVNMTHASLFYAGLQPEHFETIKYGNIHGAKMSIYEEKSEILESKMPLYRKINLYIFKDDESAQKMYSEQAELLNL